jgi:hypothetical protein
MGEEGKAFPMVYLKREIFSNFTNNRFCKTESNSPFTKK